MVDIMKAWHKWNVQVEMSLGSWSEMLIPLWRAQMSWAWQEFTRWSALTPAQKASEENFLMGFFNRTCDSISPSEGVLRGELLESLPKYVVDRCIAAAKTRVGELLLETMKAKLPPEDIARLKVLDTIENFRPIKPIQQYNQLAAYLKDWVLSVQVAVETLHARPEPQRLLGVLRSALNPFVNSGSFGTFLYLLNQEFDVRSHPSTLTLLQYTARIIAEAQQMVHDADVRGTSSKPTTAAAAQPCDANACDSRGLSGNDGSKGGNSANVTKGSGKTGSKADGKTGGGSKSQFKGNAKGKDGKANKDKPVCRNFLQEKGCPRGDRCWFRHPRTPGRCLRCGAVDHVLSSCTRPRAQATPAQANECGFEEQQEMDEDRPDYGQDQPGDSHADAPDAADHAPQAHALHLDGTFSGRDEAGGRPHGQEKLRKQKAPKIKEKLLKISLQSARPFESQGPDESMALLDSGCSNVLVNASELKQHPKAHLVRKVVLKLAAGRMGQACILDSEIFAPGVKRPLCPLGRTLRRLRLELCYDGELAVITAKWEDKRVPVIYPVTHREMMYISAREFAVIRDFLQQARQGETNFEFGRWRESLQLPPALDLLDGVHVDYPALQSIPHRMAQMVLKDKENLEPENAEKVAVVQYMEDLSNSVTKAVDVLCKNLELPPPAPHPQPRLKKEFGPRELKTTTRRRCPYPCGRRRGVWGECTSRCVLPRNHIRECECSYCGSRYETSSSSSEDSDRSRSRVRRDQQACAGEPEELGVVRADGAPDEHGERAHAERVPGPDPADDSPHLFLSPDPEQEHPDPDAELDIFAQLPAATGKADGFHGPGGTVEGVMHDAESWEAHNKTHVEKRKDCPICQAADGPIRQHKSIPAHLRTPRVLHLDLAGPFTPAPRPRHSQNHEPLKYLLVGAYRGEDVHGRALPAMIFLNPIVSKASAHVTTAVEETINKIEAMSIPQFVGRPRILRVHSDHGGEFTSVALTKALQKRQIAVTTTQGYDPQANGVAENAVKRAKTVIRRLLVSANLEEKYWAYAAFFTDQALKSTWFGLSWKQPAFGADIVAKILKKPKEITGFQPKGIVGKLLSVFPFGDNSSYVLIQDEIRRCGTPVSVNALAHEDENSEVKEILDQRWQKVYAESGHALWLDREQGIVRLSPPLVVAEGEPAAADAVPPPAVEEDLQAHALHVLPDAAPVLDEENLPHLPAHQVSPEFANTEPALSNILLKLQEKYDSTRFPRATGRTNLVNAENQSPPRSVLVGATTRRGVRVAAANQQYADLLPLIHMAAQHRLRPEEHPYCSAQLNQLPTTELLPLHQDLWNVGCNWVISFGEYTGGKLWIRGRGNCPPPRECTHCEEQNEWRGAEIDTKARWVQFNPSEWHCISPIESGTRYSMALFNPKKLEQLTSADWTALKEFGFPVDAVTPHCPRFEPPPNCYQVESTSAAAATPAPRLAKDPVDIWSLCTWLATRFSTNPDEIYRTRQVVFEVGANENSNMLQHAKNYPEIVVLSITEEIDASSNETEQLMRLACQYLIKVAFWVSMPCTGGCSFTPLNHARFPYLKKRDEVREELTVGVIFACLDMCLEFHNTSVTIELVQRSRYWPKIQERMQLLRSQEVIVHGCMVGACDQTGMPIKKPWKLLTTDWRIYNALQDLRCDNSHPHASISGTLTTSTGTYPDDFVNLILKAYSFTDETAVDEQLFASSLTAAAPANAKTNTKYRRELENLKPLEDVLHLLDQAPLAKPINITMNSVKHSAGTERELWRDALVAETSSLQSSNTYLTMKEALDLHEAEDWKRQVCEAAGNPLPSKLVLTIKPNPTPVNRTGVKRKARITVCGNFLPQFGDCSTFNLDAVVFRIMVAWGLQHGLWFSVYDVVTAFLNASMPQGRIIAMKPPKILNDFQITDPNEIWIIVKALYGFKESPGLWEDERDEQLGKLAMEEVVAKLRHVTIDVQTDLGEDVHELPNDSLLTDMDMPADDEQIIAAAMKQEFGKYVMTKPKNAATGKLKLRRSVVHAAVWYIVDEWEADRDPLENFPLHNEGVLRATPLAPIHVYGAILVYVDDFLIIADRALTKLFTDALIIIWPPKNGKINTATTLGLDDVDRITFLGVTLEIEDEEQMRAKQGHPPERILLHQCEYIDELLQRHGQGFRGRTSPGESRISPDSVKVVRPSDDPERHRALQKLVGGVLWPATRSRPDIAWAVSRLSSVMASDLHEAEVRGKHVLQYLSAFPHFGLLFQKAPEVLKNSTKTYTDISFGPDGGASYDASVTFIGQKYVNLVAWHAGKQELQTSSTCESELVGACAGTSRSKNVCLMMEEANGSAADQLLGVDNLPAIQQLKAGTKGSWRTRHISLRGAKLAQQIERGDIELVHEPTNRIAANALTKALAGASQNLAREILGMVEIC